MADEELCCTMAYDGMGLPVIARDMKNDEPPTWECSDTTHYDTNMWTDMAKLVSCCECGARFMV